MNGRIIAMTYPRLTKLTPNSVGLGRNDQASRVVSNRRTPAFLIKYFTTIGIVTAVWRTKP
jgi:hypothetical protein